MPQYCVMSISNLKRQASYWLTKYIRLIMRIENQPTIKTKITTCMCVCLFMIVLFVIVILWDYDVCICHVHVEWFSRVSTKAAFRPSLRGWEDNIVRMSGCFWIVKKKESILQGIHSLSLLHLKGQTCTGKGHCK